MTPPTIFAPAKLNLFLAITGRRPDGFHDLVSVVAPLTFGDTLTAEIDGLARAEPRFTLTCSDPEVPVDGSNLVLKAAHAFAAATGWQGSARFHLEKHIPMGAGLGGGSSNGAAALRLLNRLNREPLGQPRLLEIAASLGSDCPLFLHDRPVAMRGRGERIEPLTAEAAERLRGRRVIVFKPSFGVPTAWAYRRLAEMAAESRTAYLPADEAERRLAEWANDRHATPEALLFNNLERPAFEKFMALPTLLEQLRTRFGLAPRMTGSGSACFAYLRDGDPTPEIVAAIRTAWGESAFVVATQIA